MVKNTGENLGRILYKQTLKIFSNSGLRKINFIESINIFIRTRLKPEYIFTKKYNHKMFLDEIDSLYLSVNQNWENFETGIIEKNVKKGDIVLDIGANIGFYTLILAKLVGKKGKVYAFEADKNNFKILKKNVEINGYKNIILINKAIWNKKGSIKFYVNKKNTAGNSTYRGKNLEHDEIESIKLDDYFKKNKKVNFIKMDIEGSEGRAIKGMSNLLKENKNIKIITEFYPKFLNQIGKEINYSAKNYLDFLKKIGFKLYDIQERNNSLILSDPEDILKKYDKSFTNLLCEKEVKK